MRTYIIAGVLAALIVAATFVAVALTLTPPADVTMAPCSAAHSIPNTIPGVCVTDSGEVVAR